MRSCPCLIKRDRRCPNTRLRLRLNARMLDGYNCVTGVESVGVYSAVHWPRMMCSDRSDRCAFASLAEVRACACMRLE